jgi:hypothetical protein
MPWLVQTTLSFLPQERSGANRAAFLRDDPAQPPAVEQVAQPAAIRANFRVKSLQNTAVRWPGYGIIL